MNPYTKNGIICPRRINNKGIITKPKPRYKIRFTKMLSINENLSDIFQSSYQEFKFHFVNLSINKQIKYIKRKIIHLKKIDKQIKKNGSPMEVSCFINTS